MTTDVLVRRGPGLTTAAYQGRRPDVVLILSLLLLGAMSVVMVYSASSPRLEALGLESDYDMRRQVAFVVVGAAVFLIASLFDHRTLHSLAPVAYIAALAALVLVLVPGVGEVVKGAQRWIPVGSYQLQPAEFAKPALILMLAAVLSPSEEGKVRWGRLGVALVLVAVPAYLIFRQPDFGTMLVLAFIAAVMVFASGVSLTQLAALVATGSVALLAAWQLKIVELEQYQIRRLTSFFNPEASPLDAAYNQIQSEITIGAGGFTGRGLFEGSQTNLSFVPSQTTDFIFTAVGEQLGFIGGALLLGVYAVIIWRLLHTAVVAADRFGMLLAVGAAALVTFHVFVNVGMTLGIMPVTGLPLPFMSHGGSSFVAMALAAGLSHAIWLHRPSPAMRRAQGAVSQRPPRSAGISE